MHLIVVLWQWMQALALSNIVIIIPCTNGDTSHLTGFYNAIWAANTTWNHQYLLGKQCQILLNNAIGVKGKCCKQCRNNIIKIQYWTQRQSLVHMKSVWTEPLAMVLT